MPRSFGFVAVCLVALGCSSSALARGPFGSLHVGNWSGGAYVNDNTGQFSGCIAATTYKSAITFVVMVSPQMTWNLGFIHQNWNLVQGQQFPIVLTFDGKQPFNEMGRSISKNTVSVDMPDNSELINQFRQSQAMSAFAQGQLFQFNSYLEKDVKKLNSLFELGHEIERRQKAILDPGHVGHNKSNASTREMQILRMAAHELERKIVRQQQRVADYRNTPPFR